MKFLETITFLGNDVLVPIDKIKYIYTAYNNNSWEIHIKHDDGGHEWVECFDREEDMNKRYEMIKELQEKP